MYIPIDKLRQYFSDGKRPNGEQFYELIKSLWHKSEKIPFENIKGLYDAVNSIKFEGAKTYQTKEELLAVAPVPEAGTAAKVANDTNEKNNGYYAVVDGAWVQDAHKNNLKYTISDKIELGFYVNKNNGSKKPASTLKMTDFIPVFPSQKIRYEGDYSTEAVYFYDYHKKPIAPLEGYSGGYFEFEVPARAWFIRANSRVATDLFRLTSNSSIGEANNSRNLFFSQSSVVIKPVNGSKFQVLSRGADADSILIYEWEKNVNNNTATNGWFCNKILWHKPDEGTYTIGHAAFNFIHIIDSFGENAHVGVAHGCETFNFVKFFAGGKEFNPSNFSEMVADSFRMVMRSTIYKADKARSDSENDYLTYPSIPLIPSTRHYMDVTITGNNRMEHENHLLVLRDNIKFSRCYASMQNVAPTYYDTFMVNNKEFTVNKRENGTTSIVEGSMLLEGSSYGDGGEFSSKVTQWDSKGVNPFVITTECLNMDTRQQHKMSQHAWTSQDNIRKFYQTPVITTEVARGNADLDADVFNAGDRISCKAVTTIHYQK